MMEGNKKSLLWIVPRNPLPTRCGASHANTELIKGMTQRGYKIDLVCFCAPLAEHEKKSLRSILGVESVSTISMGPMLKLRLLRLAYGFFLQMFCPAFPLTVIPFATRKVCDSIFRIINEKKAAAVIWDGLHPMGALIRRGFAQFDDCIHLYRAHNIESMIWDGYRKSLPRIVSWLVTPQVKKMLTFESQCLKSSDAVAFVQDEDERWYQSLGFSQSHSAVVPISVRTTEDLSEQVIQRWKRINCSVHSEPGLSLLWVGGLDWWPNRQALEWFSHSVWRPLQGIRPNVSLTLIGRGTERLTIFSQGVVNALGFIGNLSDSLIAADVLIVPILSGGGIRVKALQALSHAVACVGTSAGLRGIPRSGTFVCDSATEWLQTLTHLNRHECFMRGLLGFHALQKDLSQQRSAEKFDRLLCQAQLSRQSDNRCLQSTY